MRIPYLKWWLLMFQPSWWHTFVFHSFKDTFFNNPACTKPKNKRIFILGLELANVLLIVQVKQFLFFGSDVHLKHISPFSAIYIKSFRKTSCTIDTLLTDIFSSWDPFLLCSNLLSDCNLLGVRHLALSVQIPVSWFGKVMSFATNYSNM